jgi:hypothetical protein
MGCGGGRPRLTGAVLGYGRAVPGFPQQYLVHLLDLGTRLIDSRKPKTELESLARDLLNGFVDICTRTGLDAFVTDDLVESKVPALVEKLKPIDIDGGGPRNAKPRQLADSLLAALDLELVEEPDRTITLDGKVRADVVAALASTLEAELALPKLRDTIIATARVRVEEQYFTAFERLTKELDERGQRITKQLKLPIDAVRGVERALTEARKLLMERVGGAAIDRAKAVLERANPEAAARIDQPVSVRSTPREVAILRALDPRVPKTTAGVVDSLLGSLTELARLAWLAPEKPVRTYSPKETFSVGELIEHPKFGRGTVTAVSFSMPRFDVEFADGKVTLVHVQPKK